MNEHQAALERLRRAARRVIGDTSDSAWPVDESIDVDDDPLILAQNFLAMHDDTPLDVAFIERMGWYLEGNSYTHYESSIWLMRDTTHPVSWNLFAEVYDIGTLETRGDLLLLHRALKFPITLTGVSR